MASQGKHKFKETEIGMIPEDWEVKQLGEIANFRTGKLDSNFARENGQYPFFTCAPQPLKIDSYSFDCEAILLAGNNANGIFHTNYYKGKFDAYQRTYVVNPKNKNTFLKYLYYQLNFRLNYLKEISQGTATRFLTMVILNDLEIPIPPIPEQESIASILSSLDDKIELNQQMNATLEKIGQALFKHWFIDFEFPDEKGRPYKSSGGEMVDSELGQIPKGWEIKEFGSMFDLTMGLSPKGESYNSDGEGTPLLNGAADFKGDGIFPTKYTTRPTRLNKAGDLIFCIRGTIGNIVIADKKYCLGRGVAAITPKSKEFIEFIYFKLHEKMEELIQKASGSVIIGLSKEDITKQKIIRPHPLILELFHKQMEAAFLKKQLNSHEAEDLKQTRDSLLPRFMSGRIRVGMTQ